VVVGDVSAQDVFAEAQKWFGAIPARALPVRKKQGEPAQRGGRRTVVAAPAELPFLLLGWHAPSLRDVEHDVDPYALYLLAAILDGSDAARLPRSIVREQRLAVSVDAGYDPINRGPGLFVVSAVPSPGRTVEELENALRAEIRRIAEAGVSDEELKRSKVQAVAQQVFERDSMYAQAMQIGTLDNTGLPPDSIDAQLRRLQQVTAAQVQEAAKKYFGEDKLTLAVLKPEPLPAGARAKPANGAAKGDLR
jgi:zinc protease